MKLSKKQLLGLALIGFSIVLYMNGLESYVALASLVWGIIWLFPIGNLPEK